jgi:hypothetical protein
LSCAWYQVQRYLRLPEASCGLVRRVGALRRGVGEVS